MTNIPCITMASIGYVDYTANAYRQCARWDVPMIVYAVDTGARDALWTRYHIPSTVLTDGPPITHQTVYGTVEFRTLVMHKLDAIAAALRDHETVMWIDSDVAIRQDPTQYVNRIVHVMREHNVDLAMQCDDATPSCSGPDRCWMCSGLMVIRRTAAMVEMVSSVPPPYEFPESWDGDQDYINWFVRTRGLPVLVLSRELFPNGVCVNADAVSSSAVMVHYNYIVGDDKRATMIRHGDWIV